MPDAFLVKTTDASLVSELTEKIRSLPGVEMADYGEELVARLLKLTGWLNKLFVGVSILLALGAVFLIITTIRLSVLARQEEIGIMKYLGASDWYIRFPFLLEGMAMGWIGTLASTAALGLAYSRLAASLQQDAFAFFIRPVTAVEQLVPIFLGFVMFRNINGWFGQRNFCTQVPARLGGDNYAAPAEAAQHFAAVGTDSESFYRYSFQQS